MKQMMVIDQLMARVAFAFNMEEVNDPYGVPFGTPEESIVFNYWLYHRQDTPVQQQPEDLSQIPGHRINFLSNTGPHWDTVPDFATGDADFPFPPGILDDGSALDALLHIRGVYQMNRSAEILQPVADFDAKAFRAYSFNKDFPALRNVVRVPPDEYFTFYEYHPYEYLYEYAKYYAGQFGLSIFAFTPI